MQKNPNFDPFCRWVSEGGRGQFVEAPPVAARPAKYAPSATYAFHPSLGRRFPVVPILMVFIPFLEILGFWGFSFQSWIAFVGNTIYQIIIFSKLQLYMGSMGSGVPSFYFRSLIVMVPKVWLWWHPINTKDLLSTLKLVFRPLTPTPTHPHPGSLIFLSLHPSSCLGVRFKFRFNGGTGSGFKFTMAGSSSSLSTETQTH